jgi:hypothetical protein
MFHMTQNRNTTIHSSRLTPPDSEEDCIQSPPSPTGAVYHGSTNLPEVNLYTATVIRSESPDSETVTAVEQIEERVDTEALRRAITTTSRNRSPRERFDLIALAELVSDPSLGGSSEDENTDDGEPLVDSSQAIPTQCATASWQMNCDIVDWEADVDLPEEYDEDDTKIFDNAPTSMDHHAHYERYFQQLEPRPQYVKPIFRPKGRWAFSEGQDLTNVRVIKALGGL